MNEFYVIMTSEGLYASLTWVPTEEPNDLQYGSFEEASEDCLWDEGEYVAKVRVCYKYVESYMQDGGVP